MLPMIAGRGQLRWAWLALAAILLAFRAAPAVATPVAFDVDYLTLSGQSCIRSLCAPITPGGTFQKSFTIDSSLLSVPGSYDVLPSLRPPYPFIPGTTFLSLAATAVVAGGTVVDLVIQYSQSASNTIPITGTSYSSQAFSASVGSWTSSSSSSNSLSNGSSSSAGSYVIRLVPEPGGATLVAAGISLLAGLRRGSLRGRARSGSRRGGARRERSDPR